MCGAKKIIIYVLVYFEKHPHPLFALFLLFVVVLLGGGAAVVVVVFVFVVVVDVPISSPTVATIPLSIGSVSTLSP